MFADVSALSALVDCGDDVALSLLADALEDDGDTRAVGLRLILVDHGRGWRYHPFLWGEKSWGWLSSWMAPQLRANGARHFLEPDLWRRLKGGRKRVESAELRICYPFRSAAIIALAAALISQDGQVSDK